MSDPVRLLLRADEDVVVWWGTPVECISAVARLERTGELEPPAAQGALDALALLRSGWTEVVPSESVRDRASRLLRVHPLRAADALQGAAALVWAGGSRSGPDFVTVDERLGTVMAREGFTIRPE
jgi:predicted nucleic acid-binding protein